MCSDGQAGVQQESCKTRSRMEGPAAALWEPERRRGETDGEEVETEISCREFVLYSCHAPNRSILSWSQTVILTPACNCPPTGN